MIHGFFTYGAITPMYRTLIDEVAAWVTILQRTDRAA